MKFYNQVNAKHRAEAAALTDDLLTSSTDAEATDHEKTDAQGQFWAKSGERTSLTMGASTYE